MFHMTGFIFLGVLALHLLATCCGLFDFSNLNIDDETETEKGDGRGLHDVLLENNTEQDVGNRMLDPASNGHQYRKINQTQFGDDV